MAIDLMVGDRRWGRPWVLWFGAYAATHVLVYADSLDEALEEAAQGIHDAGWHGLFTAPDYADAIEDLIRDGEVPEGTTMDMIRTCGVIDDLSAKVLDYAESDLTYTGSGFIASWEWGLVAEDPSREEILAIAHEGCHIGPMYRRRETYHDHPLAKVRVRPASMEVTA